MTGYCDAPVLALLVVNVRSMKVSLVGVAGGHCIIVSLRLENSFEERKILN